MPATDTAMNACGAKIRFEDESGNLVDISGQANEANLSYERELGEFSVFGDGAIYRLECKKDASLSLTIIFSTAINEATDLIDDWQYNGGFRKIEIELGNRVWYGSFLMEKMEYPFKADDANPVMVKIDCKPNGAVFRRSA